MAPAKGKTGIGRIPKPENPSGHNDNARSPSTHRGAFQAGADPGRLAEAASSAAKSETPNQSAVSVKKLPEFYGLYALDSGRQADLNKPGRLDEFNFGSKVQFILFDKSVTLLPVMGHIRLRRLPSSATASSDMDGI